MVNRFLSVGILVAVLGGLPSPAQGQGWYLGSELGAHVVQALGMTGLSNDRASVCDEFINPQFATVTRTATDYLGSVSSHTLFANLYWDLRTRSRFTPYVGVGVGIGSTALTYGSLWARNANPAAIGTGEGLPNVDDIRRNLAATTSSFQGVLSDTLVSRQVLFGVQYALTEDVSLGVKGRWLHGGAFGSDELVVWDPLRSHAPNLRRDGSEPVSGQLLTDANRLWGVGLGLTYHF